MKTLLFEIGKAGKETVYKGLCQMATKKVPGRLDSFAIGNWYDHEVFLLL